MSQGLLTILSAENHNQASSMLANTLIDLISQNNGEGTIGLAGGSTPSMTYSILGQDPNLLSNVTFWLTDERWVHHDDDLSNYKMIKQADSNEILELYNIIDDPLEEKNIVKDYPEIVLSLDKKYWPSLYNSDAAISKAKTISSSSL